MSDHSRRRYEVFVGSTFTELRDARQQIIEAVLLAGHIPCGTELWPAEPQSPAGVIKGYLYPCDIHVLVVGHRYGSLVPESLIQPAPKERVSFTHWEYVQSKASGRPLVVFLQDDTEVAAARDGLDMHDPERMQEDRFRAFREELKKQENFMLVRFSNTEAGVPKLQGQCIAALGRLTKSGLLPASSGWIRADSGDAETLRAIEGNSFLKRVMDQIRQFEVLADRVTKNVGAKEAMARYFWFHFQSRVRIWSQRTSRRARRRKRGRANGANLFFESGSSLAYVAQEFERAVLDEAGVAEDWHIRTNNILCLLQFDLYTTVDGRCFPDGKPDPRDKYGAIFPNNWGVLHREPPIAPRTRLSIDEIRAIETLKEQFRSHGPTFVLATTSGWDVDSADSAFRGPHVGSHRNMLFKRVILTSGYPVVLFLDSEKLGYQRRRNCYSVFGHDLLMTTWLRTHPVAVCVGWEWPKRSGATEQGISTDHERRNSADHAKEILSKLGFDQEFFCEEDTDAAGVRTGAILLANQQFVRHVPIR